jgi:hypothetical protein
MARQSWSCVALVLAVLGGASPAAAQVPPPPPRADSLTLFVRDWTRVEAWRFFEPSPDAANPDYTYVANRLLVGAERRRRRYDLVGAVQYVHMGPLPTAAVAPNPLGPLGAGALYFAQGGRQRTSAHLYLRYLNVRVKDVMPGWSVQAGRMGYTSGAESPSGDANVDAVKRLRVDSRLLGEFEWSHYQRGFDGVRTDVDRPRYHLTAAFLRPTQGGFEDNGNVHIEDINVVAGTVAVKPGAGLRHSTWEAFAMRYDDTRAVTARPDNSGQNAAAVDLHVTTVGTLLAGVYPLASNRHLDVLVWTAWQTGDWYGQTHRAATVVVESGVQWRGAPGRPWIRGGITRATGDADGSDARHQTFFPILPTVRKYSLSTTYAVMNLQDAFIQVLTTPRRNMAVRVDVHRLTLASAADRWYYGSGATQRAGQTFGYAGRPSGGSRDLGTMLEGSVDYRFTGRWSVNGYLGVFTGGEVVRHNFTGSRRPLVLGCFENILQF